MYNVTIDLFLFVILIARGDAGSRPDLVAVCRIDSVWNYVDALSK